MQLISDNGILLIEYYPCKSITTGDLIPDLNLKVVTAGGKTQYKVLMNDYAAGNDIISKNDSGDYIITDNTKRPAQFVTNSEVI